MTPQDEHDPIDQEQQNPQPQVPEQNNQGLPNQQGNWNAHQFPGNQNTNIGTPQPNMMQQPQTRMAILRGIPIPIKGDQIVMFESARKQMMAAYICAIVSLFIGGVLLGTIALVLAIFARNKLVAIAASQSDPAAQQALRRSGTVVIVVSAIALGLNVLSLIFLYPIAMQMMQSGDLYSAFFGGGGSSGTSTNGGPIFG